MRIGIFFYNWAEIGGGTAVPIMLAADLAGRHDVVVRTVLPVDVQRCERLFDVDLRAVRFEVVDWRGDSDNAVMWRDRVALATAAARDVDALVVATDHSPIPCLAPAGVLYVHFPGVISDRSAIAKADHQAVGSYRTVFANSQFTARQTEQTWRVPTTVLYPQIDRHKLTIGQQCETARQPAAVSVGRLVRSKRHLELAIAAEHLRQQLPDFHHHVIGTADPAGDAYGRAIQSLGSDVQRDVGREFLVAQLRRSKLLWHGRGFTEPTNDRAVFEHFGMVIAEAMAVGCVPLVFDDGGPAEIVEHGVNGFRWRDLDELVNLSQLCLDDDQLWRSMSEQAIIRAAQFPDRRQFANRIEAALGLSNE